MQRFEKVRDAAEHSIGKAVCFAGLGISCVMVGFSYDPRLCLQSGAILTSLLALVMFLQAARAPRVNVRRTETWMLVASHFDALTSPAAAQVVPEVLELTYQRFGRWTALTAAVFWILTLSVLAL